MTNQNSTQMNEQADIDDQPFTQADVEFRLDIRRHDYEEVRQILTDESVSDQESRQIIRDYMVDANIRDIGAADEY